MSYYNGTRWSFTWKNGRNLATASSASGSVSFEYDSDGLRTKKTVSGGATHYYFYAGGQLLRESYNGNFLDFSYDANGYPYALKYNGTTYYYITNLQGDVMYMVDGTGATVASYEYDPYGNIVSATGPMAEINPLRYRGYYYDADTGLYYLQSRYYNPEIGRFLNADVYASTGQGLLGNNMFGYCGNNPGNYIDDDGYLSRRNIRTLKNLFKRLVKSAFNYRLKNAYFQTEGMIHGQGTFAYANAKCGLGTYKDNGCGIIAVYNALQLLGRPRSLGSIEAAFQYRHGMIAWGMGGIGPWSMDTFFIANFIPYKGFSFYNDMLYHLKEGDVVVFTVMNNKYAISEGYHTMAAQYIQGRFEVYNRWSNGVEADTIDSLALVYENSLWIYGFIVGRPV